LQGFDHHSFKSNKSKYQSEIQYTNQVLNQKIQIGITMSKTIIEPGVCGITTTVEVTTAGKRNCSININSDCPNIQKLASVLTEVDPFKEISFRGEGPTVLKLGAQYCSHPACPIPVGIIKAIEVEAGLALPRDVTIQINK
jgi:hypothetical protein